MISMKFKLEFSAVCLGT